MAIKIDIYKAYDLINRSSIIEVISHFGFSHLWCSMVKKCISSPTFSIIFNVKSSPRFSSSSSIRQGDTLSPFLFLFGMTLLDLEMKRKMAEGKLSTMGSNVINDISLLAYADDVMIITQAIPNNALSLLEVFANFKKWTGLQINFNKSHLMLSPSINKKQKEEIMEIFRVQEVSKWWTHLGIPMNGGRISSWGFNNIISKINNAFSVWRAKLLSFAEKVVLIKSLILSIPVFYLAGCKVPHCVINKIEQLVRNFL